ncbi:MAG: DUF1631 domain-containing protein [Porticoccaceae bacterium]|nr:DUF1631 domain-containing protein [Porticoccaceae bacterium]
MQAQQITSKGVDAALGVVRQHSIELLDKYFEKLLNELIECSQSSTFIGSQHEYFYARAKISQSRKEIAKRFVDYLETTFQQFADRSLVNADELLGTGNPSLSLVEDDALEERVILTTIRQRAESRYSDVMWSLNRRFSVLNNGREVTDQTNPVAPCRFCFALKQGLQSIDVSAAARAEIYRMFERVFVDHVGRIYNEVNKALTDLGVLPNLRHEVVKGRDGGAAMGAGSGMAPRQPAQAQAPAAPQPQAAPPGAEPSAGWLGGGGRANLNYHQQVYQDISSLQDQLAGVPAGAAVAAPAAAGQVADGGAAAGVAVGGVNYSVGDLTAAINQIQMADWETAQQIPSKPASGENLQPRLIAQVTELLLHHLTKLLGSEQEPAFKAPDRKTIDLVGMIFEYMLNDDQLPDSVKALLSYLHTPFLKLAFADSDFFEQNEHPARQLLNRLAEAGTRWVNRDGTSEYGVYGRIREAVERLLKDVSEDARPFTEELLSFNTFIKRVELKITTREKRATEQAKGEDRMQEVKDQVHSTVQQAIGKRDLPSAILMFLLQPWSDYMAFVLLRFGDESEQWQEAQDVIDDLLWGLALGEDQEQKRKWKEQYPELEAAIAKGFDCIGYDEGRRRKMTSAMDYVFELYLQGLAARPAPAEVRKKLTDSSERGKTPEQQTADLNDSERQHINVLEQISFGTWFDMGDGKREKVVWYNLRTMQFLFVNQSGHRTGMRTGEELARLMEAGTIRIVDSEEDKPLMDRTLEQIRADLSASAKQASAS